jgi:hypothetical protein
MFRAYSQRLLPPYSGFVQIAETDRARAQSLDGLSWEIQHINAGDAERRGRQQRCGLDRSYFRVAHMQDRQVRPYVLPACLDADDVSACIQELLDLLLTAQLPALPGSRRLGRRRRSTALPKIPEPKSAAVVDAPGAVRGQS